MAQKQPYLQVGTLVSGVDPSGALFGHGKAESVATPDPGQTLYLSNDEDLGIDDIGNVGNASRTPDPRRHVGGTEGAVRDGPGAQRRDLGGRRTRLPPVLKTVTVTIHVH